MQVITQSLIKQLYEYKQGKVCGLQFKAQYVDGVEFPASDAMALGQWFEYKCSGQKTKFGHIPKPVRLQPKKATQKYIKEHGTSGLIQKGDDYYMEGDLSKKYKDALVHVEAFQRMLDAYDFEIVATGVTIEDKELGIKGDIDLVVRKLGSGKDGKLSFIDLKYSGLIDNKWEDLGWADESLPYKDKIMIQCVHYKLLGIKKLGYEPDFYFWVFSSTNTTDRKNIRVVVDEDRFFEHQTIVQQARNEFEKQKSIGFKALPNPKRCGDCILKADCEHYVEIPQEQVVYYGSQA